MRKEKMIWKGLRVEEYIHPDEAAARQTIMNSAAIQKTINTVGDAQLMWYATRIRGTYAKLSRQTEPRFFRILEDVCTILDFQEELPEVYLFRSMAQTVQPMHFERNCLVAADYVVKELDDDVLYYLIGNAISMIMAGHVKMTTVAGFLGANMWTTVPLMPFKKYLHIADATSDRGGLLACQSFRAVAKSHFLELGLPVREAEKLFRTDEEAAEYTGEYLNVVFHNNREMGLLNKIGDWWINSTYVEGAANVMLEEIYDWYGKGYQKLRKRYQTLQENQ